MWKKITSRQTNFLNEQFASPGGKVGQIAHLWEGGGAGFNYSPLPTLQSYFYSTGKKPPTKPEFIKTAARG